MLPVLDETRADVGLGERGESAALRALEVAELRDLERRRSGCRSRSPIDCTGGSVVSIRLADVAPLGRVDAYVSAAMPTTAIAPMMR